MEKIGKTDPFVTNLVWFPQGSLSSGETAMIKRRATVQGSSYGDEEDPEPIEGWMEDERGLGIPLALGIDLIEEKDIGWYDKTSEGYKAHLGGASLSPRDPEQKRIWSGIDKLFDDGEIAVLCQAPTGFGKTITAFDQIIKRDRKALIIVTTKKLARQWMREAIEIAGFPEESVALLHGTMRKADREKLETASLIIGVVNSVVKKPEDWFYQFGFTGWDEVHRMGAREFSKSLLLSRSKYRLALSATPKRKDGCQNLFLNYFGCPSVIGRIQTMPCNIYVIRHQGNQGYNKLVSGGNTSRMLGPLTKNLIRNKLLAKQVNKAYIRDRYILGLSDRIDQIEAIRKLLIDEYEIEPKEIGIIAGEIVLPDGSRKKTTDEELDSAEGCRIILATYGMAKEGLNIPRLDWGIDLSPRADGEQKIGRIRRELFGKKIPVWVTIWDSSISILTGYFKARVKDYQRAGATMKNYVNH